MNTLNFLLYALSLRFLVFDYKLSPIQIYLGLATHPILKTLANCSFCQGCEVGLLLQLFVFERTPTGVAIAFLNAISAGYLSFLIHHGVD